MAELLALLAVLVLELPVVLLEVLLAPEEMDCGLLGGLIPRTPCVQSYRQRSPN